jgi:hypothetical protein
MPSVRVSVIHDVAFVQCFVFPYFASHFTASAAGKRDRISYLQMSAKRSLIDPTFRDQESP